MKSLLTLSLAFLIGIQSSFAIFCPQGTQTFETFAPKMLSVRRLTRPWNFFRNEWSLRHFTMREFTEVRDHFLTDDLLGEMPLSFFQVNTLQEKLAFIDALLIKTSLQGRESIVGRIIEGENEKLKRGLISHVNKFKAPKRSVSPYEMERWVQKLFLILHGTPENFRNLFHTKKDQVRSFINQIVAQEFMTYGMKTALTRQGLTKDDTRWQRIKRAFLSSRFQTTLSLIFNLSLLGQHPVPYLNQVKFININSNIVETLLERPFAEVRDSIHRQYQHSVRNDLLFRASRKLFLMTSFLLIYMSSYVELDRHMQIQAQQQRQEIIHTIDLAGEQITQMSQEIENQPSIEERLYNSWLETYRREHNGQDPAVEDIEFIRERIFGNVPLAHEEVDQR